MLFILPVGDDNPRKRTPVVNYLLLAANLAVFAYLFLLHGSEYGSIVSKYGLVPRLMLDDPAGQAWKLVTAMFLHGGTTHLIGNMLFLWIAGDNVEDRLGHGSYLFFYLFSGVVANLGHVMMTSGPSALVPCIGASGAIAGVLGAYMVWFPRRRIRFWYFFFFLMGFFSIPSAYAIGFWFLEQLYLKSLADRSIYIGVAYWAHIGGFVAGALLALALRLAEAVRSRV